jgi:hypothetical protein
MKKEAPCRGLQRQQNLGMSPHPERKDIAMVQINQAQIDQLRDEADWLSSQMTDFCDFCTPVIESEFLEYWGRMVRRQYRACDKGESSCPRINEYEELEEQLQSTLELIAGLEEAEATNF